MILFIIAGFLLAKIRKYKLIPAFKLPYLYPLFLVELIYIFFQANTIFENYTYIKYASTVQIAFMAVMILPIIRYSLNIPAIIGSGLVIGGTLLNKLVMNVNDGLMPVYPTLSKLTGYYKEGSLEQVNDGVHILGNSAIKLKFLSDYIDIGWTIFSLGDILIHAFITIIIFYTIKAINLRLNKEL